MGERVWYLGGRAVALLCRTWALTLRFEQRWAPTITRPYVAAIWHGRIIGTVLANIGCGTVTMASRSNDGALAAGIIDGVGMKATRGSASRGGREALEEMVEEVRAGASFASLTVDGPRGPWRKVKPGAIVLARRLDLPIVPVTFSCRRPAVLRSWDHMVLPKPFTKVVVVWGDPWLPGQLGGDMEQGMAVIKAGLDVLTADLDREVAGRELWPSA
ncbi:MAG: lysophospholipid acyltransferase family protein [Thermoanaerobaculales bacterium]